MGIGTNLLKNTFLTPFKAVGDIFKGAWNMTGGTVLKALGTVGKAAWQFCTFRWATAAKTLVSGTMDTAKTFLGGTGQALRGTVGLAGSAVSAGAAAVGAALAPFTGGLSLLPAAGMYAATVGVYTATGG